MIKSKPDNYNRAFFEETLDSEADIICPHCGHSSDEVENEMHFNVPVKKQNKAYPSCYQYNILVMLAKRLIEEEQEKQRKIFNPCISRWHLDRKLANRIVNA